MRTSRLFESLFGFATDLGGTSSRVGSHFSTSSRFYNWGARRLYRTATNKSFYLPFAMGAGALGVGVGFTKSMMQDPNTYAVAQQQLLINQSQRGYDQPYYRLGDPLGYPESRYNYTLNSQDPLGATGALALAAFTTRHGR
jgi:hypothetical protein